jgi:hypothetical protein
MARKLRVQYPGAIYHVMNRGDRRESIFKDDQEASRLLAEELTRRGWSAGELKRRKKGDQGKAAIA